MGAIY